MGTGIPKNPSCFATTGLLLIHSVKMSLRTTSAGSTPGAPGTRWQWHHYLSAALAERDDPTRRSGDGGDHHTAPQKLKEGKIFHTIGGTRWVPDTYSPIHPLSKGRRCVQNPGLLEFEASADWAKRRNTLDGAPTKLLTDVVLAGEILHHPTRSDHNNLVAFLRTSNKKDVLT